MAKTIIVRCVDPRFEGEWTENILLAIGPHYTLTELAGIDPLDEEGFNALVKKAKALLSINSAINRLLVLCHEDCAWCKANNIKEEEQLKQLKSLTEKLIKALPQLKVEMGYVDKTGKLSYLKEVSGE